jgi:hypothetical protein
VIESPVLFRTSERATFRRCRQQWHWKYVKYLSHPRPKGYFIFGTGIHLALEHHYIPGVKRGIPPVETFRNWYNSLGEEFSQWDEEGNKIPALELGEVMLNGYLDLYGADSDIEIIAPEQVFAIDVFDRRCNYLATYVGKMDAIGRFRSTGHLFVFEHKTAKKIEEVKLLSTYGEQGRSYLWAASIYARSEGLIGPDEYFDTVLFNILRKGVPDERPRNADGLYLNKPSKDALTAKCSELGLAVKGTIPVLTERLVSVGVNTDLLGEPSQRQGTPLFSRQTMVIKPQALQMFEERIRREAWEMNQVRNNKAPVYKSPGSECNFCEFRSLCELHEMGGDWRSYIELEMSSWSPYNDHAYLEEKS